MSRFLPTLVLACALLAVLPLVAAADVDEVREHTQGLRDELEAATDRYEEILAEIELATRELADLDGRADELEAEVERLHEQIGDRARRIFKQGSVATIELLLAAENPNEAVERASLVEMVQNRDTVGIDEAVAARVALDVTVALAAERRVELEALEGELAEARDVLEGELAVAEVELEALEEIEARTRLIAGTGQQRRYACPMDRHVTHFRDTWGAPRSGGRSHRGTDVFGPMGAAVYAFTDGVIARHTSGGLGGISLYLSGDDGSTYFYTHLQGYAALGAVGTRVAAGEHIAYNGNTGNARGGPPHIHFERHPGGGAPVNPYPILAAACF